MRVFVYGTLRRGQGNHVVLDGARFVRTARTLEGWAMLDLGAFPGVVPGDGAIVGELYEVSQHVLKRLDRLEGHPTFYHRERVQLAGGGEALMYVLTHPEDYRNREPIAGGDWCARTLDASGPWERERQ